MEYINQIIIQGVVGFVSLKFFDNAKLLRMSVATNEVYKSKDGMDVTNTQWHHVTAWDNGTTVTGFDAIKKGDKVKVSGRLTYRHYTRDDGSDAVSAEIVATSFEFV